jgi:hypothetical protein
VSAWRCASACWQAVVMPAPFICTRLPTTRPRSRP